MWAKAEPLQSFWKLSALRSPQHLSLGPHHSQVERPYFPSTLLYLSNSLSSQMPSPSAENGVGNGVGNGIARNFPTDPNDFDSDPRISFSKLDNKFILETEDGQEFEYDSAIKRWVHQVRLLRPSCALRISLRRLREDMESRISGSCP